MIQNRYLPSLSFCALLLTFFPIVGNTVMAEDVKTWSAGACDARLKTADGLWLEKGADKAAALYSEILERLPAEYEPFRALLVMRLAYARFHSGDKTGCLAALRRLDKLEYVPEHHALAARELGTVVKGRPNPALENTPVPPPGKAAVTIHVDAGAKAGGNGSATKPVRTLGRAVELSRTVKKTDAGAVHILLAPGLYVEKETIHLTARDSGLTIRSADPDRPAVLSGRTVLRHWDKVTDPSVLDRLPESVRGRVLVCSLERHGVRNPGELVLGGFSSARAAGSSHRFTSLAVPELF